MYLQFGEKTRLANPAENTPIRTFAFENSNIRSFKLRLEAIIFSKKELQLSLIIKIEKNHNQENFKLIYFTHFTCSKFLN